MFMYYGDDVGQTSVSLQKHTAIIAIIQIIQLFNSKFLKKQECVRENLYALIFFAQTFQEDNSNLS